MKKLSDEDLMLIRDAVTDVLTNNLIDDYLNKVHFQGLRCLPLWFWRFMIRVSARPEPWASVYINNNPTRFQRCVVWALRKGFGFR